MGGPWRECAPGISQCEKYGCFERDTAYCFPVIWGETGETYTLCTPTSRECEEWNVDRKNVVNHSTGPCTEARTDEYKALNPIAP